MIIYCLAILGFFVGMCLTYFLLDFVYYRRQHRYDNFIAETPQPIYLGPSDTSTGK